MTMKKKTKISNVIDGESKETANQGFENIENDVDKIIATVGNEKKKPIEVAGSDFSFENEAEKTVSEVQKSSYSDEKKPKLHHITEKIQMGMEIKHNLPDRDFLRVKTEKGIVTFIDKYGEEREEEHVIVTSRDIEGVDHVEITKGLFSMDFRNDCNFWFNRSPVVVPAMINQAVHTHVDIKRCYEMEKRKLELPILLIAALIGGAAIIIIMLWSLLG